jgi:hypothetical protein
MSRPNWLATPSVRVFTAAPHGDVAVALRKRRRHRRRLLFPRSLDLHFDRLTAGKCPSAGRHRRTAALSAYRRAATNRLSGESPVAGARETSANGTEETSDRSGGLVGLLG